MWRNSLYSPLKFPYLLLENVSQWILSRSNPIMLQPLLLWHLLLFLLYITSPSLADWSLDSSGGGGAGAGGLDDPALQLRLDRNPIVANTVTDDFSTSGTTDGGVLNFEQVPPENANIGEVPANVDLGMDPSAFEVVASSRCFPPSAGKKRRRRQRVVIRRGDDSTECSAGDMFKNTPSQFKKPPGKEQQTPTADPGSKTPPSANASPRKFIPKLVPEAEELTRIFLPKDNRPSEDHSTCRKEGYSIPVCAHDDSKSLGRLSGGYANFLDPCYPGTSLFLFLFIFSLPLAPPTPSSAPKASQQSNVLTISLRMHQFRK